MAIPTNSLTLNSNNRTNNFYVQVYTPGDASTSSGDNNFGDRPQPAGRAGPNSGVLIEEIHAQLPSIVEDYDEEPSCHPEHQSGSGPGISAPGQRPHVVFKSPENRISSSSRPSMSSEISLGSNRTLRGRKVPHHLLKMDRKDLRFPKSMPDYMRIYTRAISALVDSPQTICLWAPYPNQKLAQDLQEKHCTLGDVGMFDHCGNFEVFFNIFMSREENMRMKYHPPESFKPLEVGDYEDIKPILEDITQFSTDDFSRYKEEDSETGRCSFTFKSIKKPSDPGGGILILPEGYVKGTILNKVIFDIKLYLQNHVDSWYAPTNHWNAEDNLADGSLKLICTCYKSPIWGAAVLPRDRYQPNLPEVKMERPGFGKAYKWSAESPIRVNHGSTKRNATEIHYTIAVEVYSVLRGSEDPKGGLFASFRVDKPDSSNVSLRSRVTKSISNSLSRISISSSRSRFSIK